MRILTLFFATALSASINPIPKNQVRVEENPTDDSVFDKILAINEKAFKLPLGSPQSNIYEGDIVMTEDIQKYLLGRPKRKLRKNFVKRMVNGFQEATRANHKTAQKLKTTSKDNSVFDNILAINLKAAEMHGSDGVELFEGDILITDTLQKLINERKRGAHSNLTKLWPLVNSFREIPFLIDNKINYMTPAIYKAMEEWEQEVPCLRFVQRSDQKDYIYFFAGEGCSSPVGRQGRKQYISLGDKECGEHGTILHEIGHSLGFWHEQSRPDRDEYINIIWDNIMPSMRFNFDKQFAVNSLGVPYDYDSIMHYGPYAFSIDPNYAVTIETKEGQQTGYSHHLSKSDILQAKLMYNCLQPVKSTKPLRLHRTICKDQHVHCSIRAYNGYCYDKIYGPYMMSECEKSCKVCQ